MAQDVINLELSSREVTGKAVKHLRKTGQIPAVIHDHGKESILVQGDGVAMLKVYKTAGKHHPVHLKADSKSYTAMIKVAEFDPRKHQLNHIVFNAVSVNQKVEAEVPIKPQYSEGNESSPAERAGLMIISTSDTAIVSALPKNLPDEVYYDAEALVEVGDHVTMGDLIIPKDVELISDPAQGIASVFEPSAVAAANDAAGGDTDNEASAEAVEAQQGSVESTESVEAQSKAEENPTKES